LGNEVGDSLAHLGGLALELLGLLTLEMLGLLALELRVMVHLVGVLSSERVGGSDRLALFNAH
jgi:hypothetical protein